MISQTHNHMLLIALVSAFVLAGCGKDTSQTTSKQPPKQQVRDTVHAILPPFLSLDDIELEIIPTGPETVKVNFKAVVTSKEDLYEVDREVQGKPTVILLKVVQTTGTKASLYGSVKAHCLMDQWTLESPEIQSGLKQLGAPRGMFPAQSYATGSNEANAALKHQAANAELAERARKAALEQQERERKALEERQAREEQARREREEQARIAMEEQRRKEIEQRKKEEEIRQKEDEAAREKLVLATVPRTRYTGIIAKGDERMRVLLVFTEQKGFQVSAEVTSPDRPKEKQRFAGEIISNPKPEEDGAVYPLVLSPTGGSNWAATGDDFGWFFRGSEGSLKLRLTDTGLEGQAYSPPYYNLSVRLQRER